MIYSLTLLPGVRRSLQRNFRSLYTFVSWIATLRKKRNTCLGEGENRQSRGNDKLLPHRRLLGLRTIVKCKFKHFDIYSNCFYQCSPTARETWVQDRVAVHGSSPFTGINFEPLRNVKTWRFMKLPNWLLKSHDLWIHPLIFSSSDCECLRGGFFITGSFLSWTLRIPHNSADSLLAGSVNSTKTFTFSTRD